MIFIDGRIGVITLTLWLWRLAAWWILLEVDGGDECLPYQMGLEDEDGDGRLESPFHLAGVYNSLTDEMGGFHGWMMRALRVIARVLSSFSHFLGDAWLTTCLFVDVGRLRNLYILAGWFLLGAHSL
jgi:hypothetical protein